MKSNITSIVPKLEAIDLKKRFLLGQTEINALDGVSLTVQSGEFLAISGSSGSGKSTLLNLLGLLDIPDSGQIKINGKSTSHLSDRALSEMRAKHIGFIFQSFHLIPTLSALENVEYPLLLLNTPTKERKHLAKEILKKVGLGRHMHHRPAKMSGGQRQRVAIARAMVKSPSLILADEPTASLDRTTAIQIMTLMKDLNKETSMTFLFSSHDPVVLDYASRIIAVSEGKIESSKSHKGTLHVA
jgi:putative ABC transport system ATP-binding protein